MHGMRISLFVGIGNAELGMPDLAGRGRGAGFVIFVVTRTPGETLGMSGISSSAYWLLMEGGEPGVVYNLSSDRGWSTTEVLDFRLAESRCQTIAVREVPAWLPPSDVSMPVGGATKVKRAVGWAPKISFDQTLRDVLDYWRPSYRHGSVSASEVWSLVP
jgi:hypothetical protein